jgi:hypothetical protein
VFDAVVVVAPSEFFFGPADFAACDVVVFGPLVFVVEVFTATAVDVLGVVALGPCAFGLADAPPRAGLAMAGTLSSTIIIPIDPSHRVALRMMLPPSSSRDAIAMPGNYRFV